MLSVSEVCSGTRKSFLSTPTLFLPASSLNLLCELKKTVGGGAAVAGGRNQRLMVASVMYVLWLTLGSHNLLR